MNTINVASAIIVRDRDVLIALRSKQMKHEGYWEFPGGTVEQGEIPNETIVREIKEELGVEFKVKNQVCVIKHTYSDKHVKISFIEGTIDQEPQCLEHSELMWIDIDVLSDQISNSEINMLPSNVVVAQYLSTHFSMFNHCTKRLI